MLPAWQATAEEDAHKRGGGNGGLSVCDDKLFAYSDDNSDERNREDCCRASRFCLGQVGRRMLVDDLLKFNTPDTFLKAVLCLQCASGLPAVRSVPVATS